MGARRPSRTADAAQARQLLAWLGSVVLPPRVAVALRADLNGITGDGEAYTNGGGVLRGVSSEAFVVELELPDGGVVGQVQQIGRGSLDALRRAILARERAAPAPGPEKAPAPASPLAPEPPPVAIVAAPPPSAASAGEATLDSAWEQLRALWPHLHPQARRALIIYAAELAGAG